MMPDDLERLRERVAATKKAVVREADSPQAPIVIAAEVLKATPWLWAVTGAALDALAEAPECANCDEEHYTEHDNADSIAVRHPCGACADYQEALARLQALAEET